MNRKKRSGAKGGAAGKGRRTQTTVENRTAWSGGLKDAEMKRDGAGLVGWLLQTANDRGLTLKEMVEEIGISYGYFSQMRSGSRGVRNISEEVADAIANFLRVPRISVLIAAGRVRREDFYEHPERLDQELEAALQFIQKDPTWGPFLSLEIYQASRGVQQFVVWSYEQATHRALITSRVDPWSVIEEHCCESDGVQSAD